MKKRRQIKRGSRSLGRNYGFTTTDAALNIPPVWSPKPNRQPGEGVYTW